MPDFEDGDARDLETLKSRSEKGGKLAMPDLRERREVKKKSKKIKRT